MFGFQLTHKVLAVQGLHMLIVCDSDDVMYHIYYAYINPLNLHGVLKRHFASLEPNLKRHNQVEIIKKSLFLFWLLNKATRFERC